MEVAVNSHLKHPLILGTDWPAFTQLLGIVRADVSWQTGRGQEQAAAQTGEALAVRSIDGQLLRPDVPLSFPYFSLIKERLYRVTQDAQSKEMTTQLLVPRSCREMLFQAAHCTPMAGHLGEAKTHEHLMARPPVVCGVSEMPVGKSTGHRQSALAPITVDGSPLRENWDGPHRAIGAFRTGIPLCISSGELCNAISGSSAPALHLGEECSRGTVSNYLPSGNPERDSHGSGHGVYVTHAKRTVWTIGH